MVARFFPSSETTNNEFDKNLQLVSYKCGKFYKLSIFIERSNAQKWKRIEMF
jgi:hypothetical protein